MPDITAIWTIAEFLELTIQPCLVIIAQYIRLGVFMQRGLAIAPCVLVTFIITTMCNTSNSYALYCDKWDLIEHAGGGTGCSLYCYDYGWYWCATGTWTGWVLDWVCNADPDPCEGTPTRCMQSWRQDVIHQQTCYCTEAQMPECPSWWAEDCWRLGEWEECYICR